MKYLIYTILLNSTLAFAGPIFNNATIEDYIQLNFASNGDILRVDASNHLIPSALLSSDFPNSGVTAGTYGSSTLIPIITVDAKGRVTAASTTTFSSGAVTFPLDVPYSLTPNIRGSSDDGIRFVSDDILELWSQNASKIHIEPSKIDFSVTINAPSIGLPSDSANKFFATPAGGSGAPVFRQIANGDIDSSDLPSPIVLGQGGSAFTNGIIYDSDTGFHSPNDGQIDIYANNVKTVSITPSLETVNGDLTVTGNISAANYPPTGTANRISYFNNSGVLSSSEYILDAEQWVSAFLPKDVSADLNNYTGNYLELPVETTANYTHSIAGKNLDLHFDRNNTGFDFTGTLRGFIYSTRSEGSGTVNEIRGGDVYAQAGNGNGGSTNSLFGMGVYPVIATGTTAAQMNGLEVNSYGGGSVTGGANLVGLYNDNDVAANYNVINGNQTGDVGDNMSYAAWNSNANVTNTMTWLNLSQNGTSGYSTLLNYNLSGNVTNNYQGINQNINADVGDGNDGVSFYTGFIQSGHSIAGNVNFVSFNNAAAVTGTNNGIVGVDISNQSTGIAYRYSAFNSSNQANMTDEIGGYRHNSSGNGRTGYAFDSNISGNYTDDVRIFRGNLSVTSTNNDINGFELDVTGSNAPAGHVVNALVVNGGRTQIGGQYTPENGLGFAIGNYFATTAQINSTMTGNEFIGQVIQSNLTLQAPADPGPFGLGLTGVGVVNQLVVNTGVTQGFYRGLLLGASNPGGTGTLTDYVAAEFLGFPSFGGGVTVTNKVGLRDFNGLGQSFCNGVTDCWSYQSVDPNAHVWFSGQTVLGTSDGQPVSNAKLTIKDGHVSIIQTTAPVATVDSNAGTGATCAIDSGGTDHHFLLTLTTGSAAWASGSQCSIAFDKTWDHNAVCVYFPRNANAALASANSYTNETASTTATDINFVNADVASTEYKWSVQCE